MQKDADLKKMERRAYVSFFQDGMWDMFAGIFILGWGIGIQADIVYLAGGWFIVFGFIIMGLKKWITYPRIGYAKLPTQQMRKKLQIALLTGVMALAIVLVVGLFAARERPQWLVDYLELIINCMQALLVAVIALWFGVYRFLVYSLLIIGGGLVYHLAGLPWGYTSIAAGGIIILIGLGILVRFIRNNPKITGEGPYA